MSADRTQFIIAYKTRVMSADRTQFKFADRT